MVEPAKPASSAAEDGSEAQVSAEGPADLQWVDSEPPVSLGRALSVGLGAVGSSHWVWTVVSTVDSAAPVLYDRESSAGLGAAGLDYWA